MQHGGRVCRLAIPQRRFEVNLFRSSNRRLVEPMTQPTHDANYFQVTRSLEHHFEQHFTFNPQPSCFVRVSGGWFREDFGGNNLWRDLCSFGPRLLNGGSVRIPKASLTNHSVPSRGIDPAASIARGDAVPEPGAGNDATCAFGTAGSIPVTRASRQVKRSQGRDGRRLAI